jgi:hypothetical protein
MAQYLAAKLKRRRLAGWHVKSINERKISIINEMVINNQCMKESQLLQ